MEKSANRTPPMHQGKWTEAEEQYVEALIEAFKAGVVPIPEGTTLRVFLSSMLNCPAKRISKKMVGTKYNGRQLYVRRRGGEMNERLVKKHQQKLQEMEKKYIDSLAPIIDFHEMTKQKERAAAVPPPVAAQSQPPAPPAGSLDLQASLQANKNFEAPGAFPLPSSNLAQALQADSVTRLMQLRQIRERLGGNMNGLPGLTAQDILMQTNTTPAVGGANNDLLLSLIRQKHSSGLASLNLGLGAFPAQALQQQPQTEFLLERLKRKFEQPQDGSNAPAPAASAAKKAKL